MRKSLAIALVLVLFALPLGAKFPSHLSSVRPLLSGDTNVCTAWSINERKGLWMTAAHCVVGLVVSEDQQALRLVVDDHLFIADQHASVVKYDTDADLAMLRADVHEPGLKLGAYPHVGDEVTVYGFPGGLRAPFATWLRVSNTFMKFGYPGEVGFMVLDGSVWPGHSGSPVIDRKGKAIAVVQAHGTDRFSGMTLVSPWDVLKGFVADQSE